MDGPVSAMVAELDTLDEIREALLEVKLLLATTSEWDDLYAGALRRANAVAMAAPYSPLANAWCALVADLDVQIAARALEREADGLLANVARGDYDA